MPLVIDWVARQAGVDWPEFVYNPAVRAEAYLSVTDRFGIDGILPDADFYEQLEDFGMEVDFDGSAYHGRPIINELSKIDSLPVPDFKPGSRMGNRLETLSRIADRVKGKQYIFGICVGPFTEFCNARGMEDALGDLMDDEDEVMRSVRLFHKNGLRFVEKQLAAGADGIQLVEPCCSLISPDMYRRLVMPLHSELVQAVQKDGGFARLHICGDTNQILPLTLGTGTKILDVDHAVRMDEAAKQLSAGQVLCGNLDPAGEILKGTPGRITERVAKIVSMTGNRAILSGGCDIPVDTSVENMRAFFAACEASVNAW
jgi:MtaA/CmuA family methyltransferase